MWNVFKFFFAWFWLGVASVIGWMVLAAWTAPPVMVDAKTGMHVHGTSVGLLVGIVFAFLMCVPAYFIARPKRESLRDRSYVR